MKYSPIYKKIQHYLMEHAYEHNMCKLNKSSRISNQHVSMGNKSPERNVTRRRKCVLNTICWMVIINLYLIYFLKRIYAVDSW